MVPSKTRSRAFAVVGVFLLMSGLVLTLFDEARAVSMDFADAPAVVNGQGVYDLEIVIPEGERVPIERITAVIERQAEGAEDKTGSIVVTRATCDFTGASLSECLHADLIVSGSIEQSITSITFLGYFAAESGDPLTAEGSFGYGALLGTTTGYGYDDSGAGYGYGYDLGSKASFNAGTGYGYGRTDGEDLALKFRIVVNAGVLDVDTHYLTMVADTGSSVIGQLSSPYTAFQVIRGSGGGPGIGQDSGDGGTSDGGGGGGGPAGPQTVQAAPIAPPENARAAFQTEPVTATTGSELLISTADEQVPTIRFVTDSDLQDAQIDVVVYDAAETPSSVGALPEGTSAAQYIQVTITSGGESHRIEFTVAFPEGEERDPAKAVLLKWDPTTQSWEAKGRVFLNADGTGRASSECCSDFAVAFDEESPTVNVVEDESGGEILRLFSAVAQDNLAVDRVEFYLDGALVATDRTAPYEWTWDTSELTVPVGVGELRVRAVAYDLVDNQGEDETGDLRQAQEIVSEPDDGFGKWLIGGLLVAGLALIAIGGWFYYKKQNL